MECTGLRRTGLPGLGRNGQAGHCCLLLTVWLAMSFVQVSAGPRQRVRDDWAARTRAEIGDIVRDFNGRLGMHATVIIAIDGSNPRLSSVCFKNGEEEVFLMSFDEAFLKTLDESERRAAVAHEIGHLWIYTHFPYLQTEALANHQALKLVPLESLAKVYQKVWNWKGEQGSLANVLDASDYGYGIRRP